MALTLQQIVEVAATDTEFIANASSNEAWYGNSTDDRLTDVIATVASGVLGKADASHTHTGYAATDHTHSGYAAAEHTHSGYAAASHTHDYAASDHTHTAASIGAAAAAHTHDYAESDHTHTPASIGAAAASHSHDYAAVSHTHAQADIAGLTDALAAKADASALAGKADLVNGLVPTAQLPGYVDDVLEYTALTAFPAAGESGKIYVAQDTNKTYRWSGSAYVVISDTIALGETSSTAYRGDRGKTAYEHSQNGDVHVTAAQKAAWDSKAAGDHTHDYAATDHTHDYAASGHTHTPASIGAAAASHTHTASDVGAAAASHTHTTNVIVQQATAPYVKLNVSGTSLDTRLYKNANTTNDYGTSLADYASDGTRDTLILRRENDLANKLSISVANEDGSANTQYYLYGEHHKPTPSEIGAFASTGGTISGDTNVAGVLRVNGQQSFYFQTSSMSQTFGTNNATGGTTICCGASADVNVNGAHMKTATVVPRTNNVYMCGNATYRWAGIYSTAAVNVSSDERLKRDIKDMDGAALAEFVDKLNVVSYNYKDDEAEAKARIGLVAQDVQWADAELSKFFVNEEEDGMLSLTPADLVFPLIAAVQQLTRRVEELEARA